MNSTDQKQKHTPGPWYVLETKHCVGGPLGPNGIGSGIAMCGMRARTPEEQEANARLIAAAPDLLDALKGIVREIRAYSSPECDDADSIGYAELKAADAAIAKAEGRAS